ncbi:MAG: hypothetical protein SFZ02_20815 [bacterium]|nr:hypothetical protein [bacterium]
MFFRRFLAMLLLVSAIGIHAQQSPMPIGYNQTLWGDFSSDVDIYTFLGEAGTVISIELISFGDTSAQGALVLPDESILEFEISTNFDADDILGFVLDNVGKNYATIENFTLPITGNYGIALAGQGVYSVSLSANVWELPSELANYWLAYSYTNDPLTPNAGIALSRADGTDRRLLTRPINNDIVTLYDTCPSFSDGQILYSRVAYRLPILDFESNPFPNSRGSLGYDELAYSLLNITAPDGSVDPTVPVFYGAGLNGRYFGMQVVYQSEEGDIFVDGVNITNSPDVYDSYPSWSSDGSQILWTADDDVWVMNSDGSDPLQLIPNATQATMYEGQIAYISDNQLFVTDGTTTTQLTNDVNATNLTPSWSPDGEFLAFQSDLANIGIRFAVHVLRVSNPSERYAINVDGGESRCPSFAPFTTIPSNSISDYRPVVRGGNLSFGELIEDGVSMQNQDYWLFEGQAGDIISGTISAEQLPLVEVLFYSDSTPWTLDELLSLDSFTLTLSLTRIGGNAIAPLAPRETNFVVALPYSGYYMVRVLNSDRYEQPYSLQVQAGGISISSDPLAPVTGETAYAFNTPVQWLDFNFFTPDTLTITSQSESNMVLSNDDVTITLRTSEAVENAYLDYTADNANPINMLRAARTSITVRDTASDNTQILIGDAPVYGFSYIKESEYGVFIAVPSTQGLVLIQATSPNDNLNTLWGYAVGVAETLARSATVDVFVPPPFDPETLPEDIQAIRDEFGIVSGGLLPRVVPAEDSATVDLSIPTGQATEWGEAGITFIVPDSYFSEYDDFQRNWFLENPADSRTIFLSLAVATTLEGALEEGAMNWEVMPENVQTTPENAQYFITTSAAEGQQTVFMAVLVGDKAIMLQGRVPRDADVQPLIDDMRSIVQGMGGRELNANTSDVPFSETFEIAIGETWRGTNEFDRAWVSNVEAGQTVVITVESLEIDPQIELYEVGFIFLAQETSQDQARSTVTLTYTFDETMRFLINVRDVADIQFKDTGSYTISVQLGEAQTDSEDVTSPAITDATDGAWAGFVLDLPADWVRTDYDTPEIVLFSNIDSGQSETFLDGQVVIFFESIFYMESYFPVYIGMSVMEVIEARRPYVQESGFSLGDIVPYPIGEFTDALSYTYTDYSETTQGIVICFMDSYEMVYCVTVGANYDDYETLSEEAFNILSTLREE